MKKIYLFLVFLAFLIQFSFLPMLSWNIQIPNLILIIVTVLGIRKTLMENIGWFLLVGFIFEIFSIEFFGFNLILFVLIGSFIWFFRNIILNKEYNILIEILFWFLIKVAWDLSYSVLLTLWNLLQKINEGESRFFLSVKYFEETIIFVLIGVSVTIIYKKFLSDK